MQSQCASTNPGPCDGNVLNYAYNWDALGNLNYRQDMFEGYTEHFCYDNLNRLIKSSVTGTTCSGANKVISYGATGSITKKSDICNTAIPAVWFEIADR